MRCSLSALVRLVEGAPMVCLFLNKRYTDGGHLQQTRAVRALKNYMKILYAGC